MPLIARLAHRLSPAATRRGPRLRGLHPREVAFAARPLFTVLHAAPLFGFRSSRHRLLSVGLSLPASSARDVSIVPPSLFAIAGRFRPQRLSRPKPGVASPLRLPARAFEPFLRPSVLDTPTHRPLPCDDSVREVDLRSLGCPSRSILYSRSSCSSVARRARRVRSTSRTVIDSFTMRLSSRPPHSAVARFMSLSRRARRSVSRSTRSSHDTLTTWLRHAVSLFHDALTAWLPTR